MSALGVDAVVLGNHEFDRGAQNIATQFQRWANFPLLAANYKFDQTTLDIPNFGRIGTVARPFVVLNTGGLSVAAIGMGNLSSLTSIFDQPNKTRPPPAQHGRGRAVVHRSRCARTSTSSSWSRTSGSRSISAWCGARRASTSCSAATTTSSSTHRRRSATAPSDPNNPGYVWAVDPNAKIDTDAAVRPDGPDRDPKNHPFAFKRPCHPRKRDHRALGRVREVRGPARPRALERSDATALARRRRRGRLRPRQRLRGPSSRYQASRSTRRSPRIRSSSTCSSRTAARSISLPISTSSSATAPSGSKRFATTRRRLAARQRRRQRDLAPPRHPDRLLAHELHGHPRGPQPRAGDRRADVQHLPVRQLDHEDAALRRSRCRSSSTSPPAARRAAAAPRRSRSPALAFASTARAAIASTSTAASDARVPGRHPASRRVRRPRSTSASVLRTGLGLRLEHRRQLRPVKKVCVVEACAEQVYIGHKEDPATGERQPCLTTTRASPTASPGRRSRACATTRARQGPPAETASASRSSARRTSTSSRRATTSPAAARASASCSATRPSSTRRSSSATRSSTTSAPASPAGTIRREPDPRRPQGLRARLRLRRSER